MVIPLTDPSNAMKLIALAHEKMSGKGRNTDSLPSPKGTGNNEQIEQLKQIVANQQEQIQQTSQMIKVLMGIEDKPVITDEDIGKSNDRYSHKQSSRQRKKTGRLNYGV